MPELSSADAALIAREGMLPGLPFALDAHALRRLLQEAGVAAAAVQITYLRFKPGTSAVAGVKIERDVGPVSAQVVVYPVSVHDKLGRVVRRAGEELLLHDAARGLAVVTALADTALPGIRRSTARHPHAEVLVYKPGRRWVARCRACDVIIKVHAPGRAREAVLAQRAVEHLLPTAPIVGDETDEAGVVETRLLPGRPLIDLGGEERADAERRVGAVLARLHAADGEAGDADASAEALDEAVAGVAALLPAVGERAAVAAATVRAVLLPRRGAAPVHGDCSIDQVLVGEDGRPSLIDLDRARIADPLTDLGSWTADAIVRGETAADAARHVVAGYRGAGGVVDDAALLAHTAAALLRRAAEPFRARQPEWDIRCALLVDEADRLARLAAVRGDRALPGGASVTGAAGLRVVAHREGRRAVLCATGPRGESEYLKVVRPARFAAVAERAERVAGLRLLRVPRVLERNDSTSTLRLSSVGERTVLDAGRLDELSDAALRAVWARVGAGLAELHALDPAGLPRHGVDDELVAIRRALDPAVTRGLLPAEEAARELERVAAALRAGEDDGIDGVLHRDLHDKQLLVPGRAFTAADVRAGRAPVGLIDVDTLAVGERALDIANLLVHLDLRVAQGLLAPRRAREAGDALRQALGEQALWARVPAYAAAARLRLAGVYAQRDGWREVGEGLLRPGA